MRAQQDLLYVTQAPGPVALFFRFAQGGQEHPSQDCYNGNHNQQLNERKSPDGWWSDPSLFHSVLPRVVLPTYHSERGESLKKSVVSAEQGLAADVRRLTLLAARTVCS
jgi:hypothetical protein